MAGAEAVASRVLLGVTIRLFVMPLVHGLGPRSVAWSCISAGESWSVPDSADSGLSL